ncbi:MAG: MiaB/RimO family radical SAM methylthiotransferase [Candidatus Hodarchaeota archaeon]
MSSDKDAQVGRMGNGVYYSKDLGKSVCVVTNGCSENQIDCAKMQEFFTKNAWSVTTDFREADIILFNSCGLTTVREDDSLEVLQAINVQKKPSAEVIIWGCFPRINIERISEAHRGIIFKSHEAEHLEEFFEGNIKAHGIQANFLVPPLKSPHRKRKTLRRLSDITHIRSFIQRPFESRRWRCASDLVSFVDPDAFCIKVSTGCLDACSYCGVRLSRGRLKSKPIDSIMAEFKKGLDKNFRKFTLIGTDLGAYGRDQGTNLIALLNALFKNEGDYKLRLPNINPRWLTEMMPELRELVKSRKINVIGAGAQSGSNRILRLMNRRYRIEDYKESMFALKSEFPGLRLRTNIIVGFPSETEQDFQKTVQLLNEVDFTFADIHRYAPRPKAKAATMIDQIPREVTEDRFTRLQLLFSRRLRETRLGMLGAHRF